MDTLAWLRSLGLERYERAFLDNAVDAEVLPRLTAEDLKEIGVLPVGHRRKLLEAIAALRDGQPPASDRSAEAEPEPAAASTAAAAAATEAERRQLTVLLCDLVASTALAGRLDPEDLREVISAYHRCVAEVVGRWDGHIAKYMGDGVLAYFGYPRAHEDDAERAVRSALELVQAVDGLRPREDVALQVRVGIATGLVVVGDLLGEGSAREEAVVGETPNLAARLQALAEPGGIVIAPSTRRLAGRLFDYADLGMRQLKGFAGPVRAWRVVGTGQATSRFEARQAAGLTPLVGREHEVGLLLDRWQVAQDGEGQVVLLAGEPGIGKSRIVQTLMARLEHEPHTRLHRTCSPFHRNSALHPIIEQLERAAGFRRDDAAEVKLAKLEALLAPSTDAIEQVVPLVADLLSIPTDGRHPPLNLSPERRKEKLFGALVALLQGLATERPVLYVFEDVHWIDPSSLELLGLVIERVHRLPVLAVITFRPEFSPPWSAHAHVSLLTLNRLGRRQAAAMVERLTGGKGLPTEVMDQILAKTDGVPLFVEELTKTVLESGLLRDAGDRYALAGPLPPLAIPATLQDSLMARLDRLAPVKEVAQIGAVIGREFSHELMAAVAPLRHGELEDALDRLVGAELVFRRGTPPQASYAFKHALVQDAAYGTLLKGRRQQLHGRIARVLEEKFPERAQAEPELLAHHCAAAGLVETAIDYWHKAGQRAVGRSAAVEAAAHFAKALELLATLPDTVERKREELRLQTALGGALIAAKGLAAPEVIKAYARAHELCLQVGDSPLLFSALCGRYWFHSQRGELEQTLAVAEEVVRLAERQGDAAPLVIGHRIVGTSLFHLGRLTSARAHLERALALYDPARHGSLAALYTFDPRVLGLSFLSWLLYALGYPEQALCRSQEAVGDAQRLAHPHTVVHALANACVLHQLCRNRRAVEEQSDALISLATEQGFRFWLAVGTIVRGWALADGEQTEKGIGQIRRGLADYGATGAELWSPYFLALLAEAHGRTNQATGGLSLVADASDRVERSGGRWFEAELHRLKGELLLSLPEPNPAEAEEGFHRALAVARGQGARMWELRAATSLARLWRDQGKRTEAYDVLAPICGWFTEGFDTPDLKEAKALLDEFR